MFKLSQSIQQIFMEGFCVENTAGKRRAYQDDKNIAIPQNNLKSQRENMQPKRP